MNTHSFSLSCLFSKNGFLSHSLCFWKIFQTWTYFNRLFIIKEFFLFVWMQWLVTSWSFIICLNLVTYTLSHKVLIFLIVTSVIYFVSRHRCCSCSSVVYFLSATNFVDKVMALQWEYNNIRNALLCHSSGLPSLVFSSPKLLSFICFKPFLFWCTKLFTVLILWGRMNSSSAFSLSIAFTIL